MAATMVFVLLLTTLGAGASDLPPPPVRDPSDSLRILLLAGIRFYQRHLSSPGGLRCPSWPSCSRFAALSIRRYGVWGVLMAIDRMYYREHDDMHGFHGVILTDDGYRFYDPPENNWIFDKSRWRLKPEETPP